MAVNLEEKNFVGEEVVATLLQKMKEIVVPDGDHLSALDHAIYGMDAEALDLGDIPEEVEQIDCLPLSEGGETVGIYVEGAYFDVDMDMYQTCSCGEFYFSEEALQAFKAAMA